jgi:hypothetical protein
MARPRDYGAEHERRSITKVVRQFDDEEVSFWRVSNLGALDRLVPEDEVAALINNRKLPASGIYKLLELARYDRALACDLLKTPELIDATYKKLKRSIDATRPRRVDAGTRFDRSWLNYINRFVDRFAPEDQQDVLLWATKSLYENMSDETKDAFRSWQEERQASVGWRS